MEIFSPLIEPFPPVEPFKIPKLGDISVLPYIRGRLVFADLAARVLNNGLFDHLFVDFPAFMNDCNWLKLPLGLFPAVSTAAFRRNDGEPRAIAFGPNDAACIAAYLAAGKSIPFDCLDDSDMLNYPKEAIFHAPVRTGDDYRVFQQGVEGYFGPLWEQVEEAWEQATAEQQFFTRYRAKKVVSSLNEAVSPGKPTLFVCEYRLVWAIQKALQEDVGEHIGFLFKWKDAPGVLIPEDPYFAWVHGVLDDFPGVNLMFWQGLTKKDAQPFDKLRALEDLLGKAILQCRADDRPGEEKRRQKVSIRNLITFQGYLRKITAAGQRYIPEAGAQLFHAAETCAGKGFLRTLAEEVLRYPDSLDNDQINFILNNAGGITFGGSGLDVPDFNRLPSFFTGQPPTSGWEGGGRHWGSEAEARRRIVDQVHHKVSRVEKQNFSDNTRETVRWEIKADYRLHSLACAHARLLTQQQRAHFVPKRSWGRMEGGVHWKATLSALARGEGGMYVKHRLHDRDAEGSGNEFTPVVFLFAGKEEIDKSSSYEVHDGNLALRNIELGNDDFPFENHPKPDSVYSVYVTSRKRTYVLDPHIQQESLTSLSLIYTKPVMGLERYQVLTAQMRRYQCRIQPDYDPELISFPRSERGIAWALKYARDRVIVVARKGWKVPARVAGFAKEKGIKIRIVPLSAYRKDFIERLSVCYFLSTQLKKHPQREEIVRRFV